MKLLELPPEMLLAVLEWLVKLDPIVLLGSVPGVCRRMRVLCQGVHGSFDMRSKFEGMNWDVIQGALTSAALRFPWTRGLWTFSRFPLHHSCKTGMSPVAKRLLNEDRSRLDEKDRMGSTPFHYACPRGFLDIAQVLLDNGAEVDKPNSLGNTALRGACLYGHLDVARLLVEKGADVNKVGHDGRPLLDLAYDAIAYGFPDMVTLLEQAGASR